MHILSSVMGEDVATKHDVAALSLRMDKLIEGVERRIDGLEVRFDVLGKRVDGLDKRIDSLEDKMKSEFARMELRIEEKFEAFGYKLQLGLMLKLGGLITFLFGIGFAALGFMLS